MKFAVITHALHYREDKRINAYAPYVNEMNLWGRYVDQFLIVAPKASKIEPAINMAYEQDQIRWYTIPSFSITSIVNALSAIILIPVVFIQIFRACVVADHIHLRCPGNVGLLGCLVQIFFPGKPKTAKYAGNWGSNKKQPWSYRLQKSILRSTVLTRNMKVLVYGEWPGQTSNIKPFFTATYLDKEKIPVIERNYNEELQFIFAGTFSPGKQPLWAARFVHSLLQAGQKVKLHYYGDGIERRSVEEFIRIEGLEDKIVLHGNQPKQIVKAALQNAHFLLLPSKSEGWPKVVAEAMFWGCIPIVTPVSCVPWMLDYGKRGFLISESPAQQANSFIEALKTLNLNEMAGSGVEWSRNYTLDRFEKEIQKLL